MTGSQPRPPRLARWLLRLAVRPPHQEFLIGDLDECYAAKIAPGRSRRLAQYWYWRQTFAVLFSWGWHAARQRRRLLAIPARRARLPVPGGSRMLGQALRGLRRQPGFALTAVATLALGIGANASILSAVNALYLRALPYPDADRLVFLWRAGRDGQQLPNSYPNLDDLRRSTDVFDRMAAWLTISGNMTGVDQSAALSLAKITPSYFGMFGVRPLVGRLLSDEDERESRHVMVMNETLWRSHFGSDPSVVGRFVTVNDAVYEVVGVARAPTAVDPTSGQPLEWDAWHPISTMGPGAIEDRTRTAFDAVWRVAPSRTIDQARGVVSAFAGSLRDSYPAENGDLAWQVVSVREQLFGGLTWPFALLMSGAALVLLVGTLNVTTLLLVRATVRAREAAVRRALGASVGRVIAELAIETLLLFIAGAGLGLLGAYWTLELFVGLIPIPLPAFIDVSLDWRVTAFVVLVAAAAAIPVALAPAVRTLSADLRDAIGTAGAMVHSRAVAGSVLVAAEVGLAVTVLIGAGLMVRSLHTLRSQDLGFETRDLVLIPVVLGTTDYPDATRVNDVIEELRVGLGALPGVTAVEVMGSGTPGMTGITMAMTPDATSLLRRDASGDVVQFRWHRVSPGFIDQLGLHVVRGRGLDAGDRAGANPVAVVSEGLAARLWPGEDPIGRTVPQPTTPLTTGTDQPATVVGVVSDARHSGRIPRNFQIQVPHDIYFSWEQQPNYYPQFILRSTAGLSLAESARRVVRGVDRDLVVGLIRTVEQHLDREEALPRFMAFLMSTFAGAALGLSLVGLYAVLSYTVTRRTRELGLRVALGATHAANTALIVRHGLALGLLGVVPGFLTGLVLVRLAASVLYEISPFDPVALVASPVIVLATTALASYLPARRASRVDPLVALHSE